MTDGDGRGKLSVRERVTRLLGTFRGKVMVLATGTTAAQAVDVLAIPVITRLYDPEAFGRYGTFLAILMIAGVFATWRYERGLVITRSPTERRGLFALLVTLSLSLAMVFLVAWLAWPVRLRHSFIGSVMGDWGWLLAVALAGGGIVMSLEFLGLRHQMYLVLAASRFAASATLAGSKIVLGLLGGGAAVGLPLSTVISQGVAIAWLGTMARVKRWLGSISRIPRVATVATAARRNAEFPGAMTWSSLCNTTTGHLPVLVIGSMLGSGAAGFFYMAYRLLAKPLGVVISSVADVAFQEAADQTPQAMRRSYLVRARRLALWACLPLVVVWSVSPTVVPVVLGAEWAKAGVLTRWLAPGLFVQLVLTPFTSLFTALREQGRYLAWAVMRLSAVGIGLVGGATLGGISGAAIGFSIATAASFLVQHLLLLHVLDARLRTETAGHRPGPARTEPAA